MTASFDGSVEIKVGPKAYTLKCTPRAMMTLFSAHFGGASGLIDRLKVLDVDAIVAVIVAGAGVKNSDVGRVQEHVFRAGPGAIVVPIIEYVVRLNNGGRSPDPSEDQPEDGDEGNDRD